jgi:hypothetical protein
MVKNHTTIPQVKIHTGGDPFSPFSESKCGWKEIVTNDGENS